MAITNFDEIAHDFQASVAFKRIKGFIFLGEAGLAQQARSIDRENEFN